MSHPSNAKAPLTATTSSHSGAPINYRKFSTKDKQNQHELPFWQRMLYNKVFHFAILVGLCGFIGIGLPIIWSKVWTPKSSTTIESDLRYNCYPLRPTETIKHENCPKNVCKWDNVSTEMDVPCYYGMKTNDNEDTFPHYTFMEHSNNSNELNYKLQNHNLSDLYFLQNHTLEEGPVVVQTLELKISYYDLKHMRVVIKPEGEMDTDWSTQYNYPEINNALKNNASVRMNLDSIESGKRFQLKIERFPDSNPNSKPDSTLFDMGQYSPFIFADGLREISTALPNDLIFGIGQSNMPKFRHNFTTQQKWQLFSQYQKNITENSTMLFGSHPFYLGIDNNGAAYGVLLLNSFPIEASTNARPSLTLRTIGGQFEFHFFVGDNPKDVLKQLQQFIYRPAMPPYWALGFHLCQTLCQVESDLQTIKSLREANITVESDCGTALRSNRDNRAFQTLKQKLNDMEMNFMSMLPPHIFEGSSGSSNLKVLLDRNLLPYSGTVQKCDASNKLTTGNVHYPDFFHNTTFQQYRGQVTPANGYLLDFNTPINMINKPDQLFSESCQEMLNKYWWNKYYFKDLNQYNPCLDIFMAGQNSNETYTLQDLYLYKHNLYGYKQMETVHKSWLDSASTSHHRPLIMSLSTFIGSGRYGGHLGAPINATWEMLRFTLKQTLDFSLFGIPLTGFPVGGFFRSEEKNDELMQRWFQLASILPFMISYSDYGQSPPALITSVRGMIASSIQTRYRLLPYFYTLFYKASTQGSLVVQPLFIEFPEIKDKKASLDDDIYDIDQQFMLGSSLLVSPALEEEQIVIRAFFPKGRWYDYYSGHITWKADSGFMEDLSVTEQHINLHLRGGHLVPTQEPSDTISKTRRTNGYQVIAALDEDGYASGDMYIDDGISQFDAQKGSLLVKFEVNNQNVTIDINKIDLFCETHSNSYLGETVKSTEVSINTILSTIKLYGIIEEPENRLITITQPDNVSWTIPEADVKYENKLGVLQMNVKLDLCKSRKYIVSWNYKKWTW